MAKIRYIEDKEGGIVLPVTHERGVVDSSGTTLETKLGGKQATLVSGENIKTINNESLLGSGNIEVAAESIDTVEVSVDSNTGTPSATASVSGSTLTMAFHNLKGETGATGPQGERGLQGNTGSSVDYPYELVNNLTTDDATKGLSAAQGVVLDGKVSQLRYEMIRRTSTIETVDFSLLTRKSYLIQSGGSWGTASSYKHYMIPIEPGRYRFLALQGNAVNTSVYAFLTSGTAHPGNAAAFASPTTRRFDVGLGEEVLAEIPETASYIYIYSGDSRNGTDLNLPQWVELRNPLNEQVIANSEDISKMRLFLSGKRVSIIGDSITYGRDASDASKIFHGVLASLSGCEINNLGVSGTCIASNTKNGLSSTRFVTRATAANLAGSDLVIVFGGTNDFSYDSKPNGNLFSETAVTTSTYIGSPAIGPVTDTDTFAGALHDLILTIRQNCPNVPVMFITPMHRGRYNSSDPRPSSSDRNSEGNYLYEFVNAMKEICAFYAIPVLDLYSAGCLDFSDAQMSAVYSSANLHPNDAGHEVIGNLLYKFINANLNV